MSYHIYYIRYGDLVLEWNEAGDLSITRQSTAQRLVLSITEWQTLLKAAELHGWPVAPPQPEERR